MTKNFNFIFNIGDVSTSFKRDIIFPIFKKGDSKEPSNYRDISFLNTVTKIFRGVLLERLTDWVHEENLLIEYQAGFRKGQHRLTVDNIFARTRIAQKLYAFFMDFKAAFDSIDRKALIYKHSNLGVSTKLLRVLKALYDENMTAVWDGNILYEWFPTETGVQQGCLLSPLLVSLFPDDLVELLPGGIILAGMKIKQ